MSQSLTILILWIPLALLLTVGSYGILTFFDGQNRAKLNDYAATEARAIANLVEPLFAAATSVGTLIEYDVNEAALEDHALDLLQRLPLIHRISIAPKGVIDRVFPKNEAPNALGLNILIDDERFIDAQRAMFLRSITLTGPYKLREGELGFTARYPVYTDKHNGQGSFWGFTSIVFLLDTLMDLSGLQDLDERGYKWALGALVDESTNSTLPPPTPVASNNARLFHGTRIFASSGDAPLVNPVSADIAILNTSWQLFVEDTSTLSVWMRLLFLLSGSIALSGIIAILAGLYHDRNRHLRREIAEHRATGEKLAQLAASRELLIRETHHRIKNNLSIVESIVSLQSGDATGTRFEDIFSQLQKRIHSISLIHERLYRSTELDRVALVSYTTDLVEFIRDSVGNDDQHIILDVDAMDFTSKAALSAGLILTELCMNAIKHGATGTVHVRLKRHNELVILAVENEGAPVPDDYRNRPGLGLKLVDSLATQLGGEWHAENGPPIVFSVVFPAANALADSPV